MRGKSIAAYRDNVLVTETIINRFNHMRARSDHFKQLVLKVRQYIDFTEEKEKKNTPVNSKIKKVGLAQSPRFHRKSPPDRATPTWAASHSSSGAVYGRC